MTRPPLAASRGGRRPPRRSPTYAVRAPLAAWLRAEAEAAASRHPAGYRVLDVGCGAKPYSPLFADSATEYLGVDAAEGSAADLHGSAADLPVPDGAFEIVLCTQVLEHARKPDAVVRELRRVVAPGGRVLASTHGVQVYHPAPEDLWRWTHTGLEHLFRENADWTSLTVSAGSGAAACIGMLISTYVDLLLRRARLGLVGAACVGAINGAAEVLERRVPALREPRPGAIFANYHVTAIA